MAEARLHTTEANKGRRGKPVGTLELFHLRQSKRQETCAAKHFGAKTQDKQKDTNTQHRLRLFIGAE